MALAPDRVALKALEKALSDLVAAVGEDPPAAVVRRIRKGLSAHSEAIEEARSTADSIRMPRKIFDPSNPKDVGRMVSIALLAQPLVPLLGIQPAYGSGVYAIYYRGSHPLYSGVTGSETPIYVGKADPVIGDASDAREQGSKLTARLMEHARTIASVENYSGPTYPSFDQIRLGDFYCRRLVCATNAQLVAEKHLIQTFRPIWNSETKACWGMSKHGDSAKTRANKRSPWDVVHPGRSWALDENLEDSLTPDQVKEKIEETLRKVPARRDHSELLEEMLAGFRQDDTEVVTAVAGIEGDADPERT
ncbi:Eco29kI family restriction endonuclease [Kordiimonas aestuarii]|uniref:Eco29kI family restriction endonuclease n=1 Tax=Kordiimonas aestuarii TaxID=1005925 RepID=UPI0021CDFB7E|nr:Eco29kI family restriction endonuclease [Kordiimonas aestuarii]